MEQLDPLVTIIERNNFYKRQYVLILLSFLFSLVLIGVLMWGVVYLISNPPVPYYFATDKVGRLIKIVPTDEPNMSVEDLLSWTIEAVQTSYSYDYINYHAQLQNMQKYYTNDGWFKYFEALTASNNLIALTKRNQVVVAQVVDTPKILSEGRLGNSYAWKLQMPMLVTYMMPPFDNSSQYTNALTVTVIVQRQPILQSYKGLAIAKIIVAMPTNVKQEMSSVPAG